MSSLQMIIGDASYDHLEAVAKFGENWLAQGKERQLFYLVPNSMKFAMEIKILEQLKGDQNNNNYYSNINIQVLSLSRLAWYLMPQKGQKTISKQGLSMLLYDLINENKEELLTFKHEIKRTGFLEKITDIFVEFLQGNIDTTILFDYLETLAEQEDITLQARTDFNNLVDYFKYLKELKIKTLEWRKYADFVLLYALFEQKLQDYQFSDLTVIKELTTYLQTEVQDELKQIRFILTGFDHFTSNEFELIQALRDKAGSLMIDLVLNKQALKTETEAFALTKRTYLRLASLATEQVVDLTDEQITKFLPNWNNNVLSVFDTGYSKALSEGNISLTKCLDNYQEMIYVANEIKTLIAAGYRYKDLRILTANIEEYKLEIEPIFNEYGIPYHIASANKMNNHPLVNFVKQLLQGVSNNYQQENLINLLRQQLYLPTITEYHEVLAEICTELNLTIEQLPINLKIEEVTLSFWNRLVDIFENNLLEYVPNFANALNFDFKVLHNLLIKSLELESSYQNYQYIEVKIVQKLLQKHLVPIKQNFAEQTTYQGWLMTLVAALKQFGIPQRLSELSQKAEIAGDLYLAKKHYQAWQKLMELLEEVNELLGTKVVNFNQDFAFFIDLLKQTLAVATYSQVPATLDQVEILETVRQPLNKAKVTFVIGCNSNDLPRHFSNESLLNDAERLKFNQFLQDEGTGYQFLTKDAATMQLNEPYYAYRSLMSATERLYLTFSKQDLNNNSIYNLSPYLTKELLNTITVKNYDLTTTELNYLASPKQIVANYVKYERERMLGNLTAANPYAAIYEQIKSQESEKVVSSLSYRNKASKLAVDNVQLLYNKNIYASPSAFETYYSCEYKYLLQRALRVKERVRYVENDSRLLGNLYHEILDQSIKKLQAENKKITDPVWLDIVATVARQVMTEPQYGLDYDNPRINYLRYRLQRLLEKVSQMMQQQMQTNPNWQIETTELGFKGLQISLTKDHKIILNGKVDRIDTLTTEKQKYYSVVDYKSSDKDFKWSYFYNGLLLQLPTYLKAVKAKFHLKNEQIAGGGYEQLTYHKLKNSDTANEVKEWKIKGFYQDKYLTDFETNNSAEKIYGISFKNNGELNKRSAANRSVDGAEGIKAMLDYTEELYLQAGKRLYSGEIAINPYKDSSNLKACDTCPFRSICVFDPMMENDKYRKIANCNKQEVFKKITEKEEADNDEVSNT